VNQYQDAIAWCTSPVPEFAGDMHIIQFYIRLDALGTYAGPMVWKPRTPPGLMIGHFIGRGAGTPNPVNCAHADRQFITTFISVPHSGAGTVVVNFFSGDGIGFIPPDPEGRLGLDVDRILSEPNHLALSLIQDDGNRAEMDMFQIPLITDVPDFN
jgi:hypothetical protein